MNRKKWKESKFRKLRSKIEEKIDKNFINMKNKTNKKAALIKIEGNLHNLMTNMKKKEEDLKLHKYIEINII